MVSGATVAAVALQIEKQTLEQMIKLEYPTTASFQHLGFMVEAFDKTACLTVDEVVGNLLEPVVERGQEAVETFQPTVAHIF